MKNLKHIIYLFTIFFLFISCENNTKKPDIKKANISEVNRPTPNNTELEKKIDTFNYSSIEWRPLNYIDLEQDQ